LVRPPWLIVRLGETHPRATAVLIETAVDRFGGVGILVNGTEDLPRHTVLE
jgi:hypothetical protein